MRDFVSAILEDAGEYTVHEVENGFEALRALPRVEFALIVTDINVPDINGIELIRVVRQNTKYAHTPIVVISTDGRKVDRDRAMQAGASAFLTKPFTPEQLLEAIALARTVHAGGSA